MRQKVVADMLGLALRTYQKKMRRLWMASTTERDQTLWEAVVSHIADNGRVTRETIEARFRREDAADLAAVIKDLVARYDALSNAWGMGETIDSVNPGSSTNLRLSSGPGDGVLALWRREGRLWWARYHATAGAWEVASLLHNGPFDPGYLSFGVDDMGVGHVTYYADLAWWWTRHDPGSDRWSDGEQLDLPLPRRMAALPLRVAASGDLIMGTTTNHPVWGKRYDAASGQIAPREALGQYPPAPSVLTLTFAGPGHAVFVWREGDGIWAHRYE